MEQKEELFVPGNSPVCKANKEYWERERKNIKVVVDGHTDEIRDLKDISNKLTTLLEITAKQTDKLTEQYEEQKYEALQMQIEYERKRADEAEKRSKNPMKASDFYTTKSFELIVRTVSFIAVILTTAAVGMNYFKEYLAIAFK